MIIRSAEYIGSFPKFSSLPNENIAEFCFWGRSNVGKSSLINSICNRKELALISSTPGKTVNFNFFKINGEFNIIDLPGYGYAQVSKKQRAFWSVEINKYLLERNQLICIFLLVDISISIQKADLEKILFMGNNEIPFMIVCTKSDKIKKTELNHNIQKYKYALKEYWEEFPEFIITSSIENTGKSDLLNCISSQLNTIQK
ncbi:MAG: YihA family ribosome biogenesis GTP-binding protein [Saprospiraceae bacterium]|nr:YihA family ribosome biogenesis GTP-binding protein [Saprospiraceae bacterium]